jgi:aminoacyl tRNA synthase complex-interacting multifunctional protein 1
MTAGSVPSSAALCALHVDSPAATKAFEQDVVLQLVLQLAPTLQCKVIRGGQHSHPPHDASAPAAGSKPAAGAAAATATTGGGPLRLQVGPHEHENLLRQRNSIVRALCGMGLHGLMDHRFKLLGGHAVKAFRASSGNSNNSATSSLALASIVEWMAVAQNLNDSNTSDEEVHGVLARCESHLATHAFLVPFVPNATVADYDVAVTILTRPSLLEKAVKGRNVSRWLRQCHAELVRHGIHGICSAAKVTLLAPPAAAPKLPIFYSGTEAAAPVTAAASVTTSNAKAAAHAPSNNNKEKTSAPPPKQAPTAATKAADPSPNAKADSKKSDKKAAKAAAAAAAPASAPIPAEYNVGSLDIRVGQIIEVWEHETADKLFCEVIDLGSEQRKIASGLRPFYSLKDLENRKVLVLCNLKARNLVGFPSHGMVLCASNDDHTAVEFVVPPPDAPLGSRVVFDGYESVVPEPEAKVAKKKIFELVSPDLRTNANGQVAWKGALGRVEGTDKSNDSASVVKALNGTPNARVS